LPREKNLKNGAEAVGKVQKTPETERQKKREQEKMGTNINIVLGGGMAEKTKRRNNWTRKR